MRTGALLRTFINEVHNQSLGDTVKELSRDIMCIYQDRNNNYWLGSWTNGLYMYDGKFLIHYGVENGLPYNKIDDIKEDQSGNLYFSSCS